MSSRQEVGLEPAKRTGSLPKPPGAGVPQRVLNLCVRPYRVAVLIADNAGREEVMVALTFLSRLWGGRHCQILAVPPTGDDPVTSFRLSQSRPDFVYGIGVEDEAWRGRVMEACQPRDYGPLARPFAEAPQDSFEEHTTAGHVIHYLRRTPVGPGSRDRPVRLVGCDPASPLAPFVAALYGIAYDWAGSVFPNEACWLPDGAGVPAFIAGHSEFIASLARNWLDMASNGLTLNQNDGSLLPPTIVLVGDSLSADLALFWNLRTQCDGDSPPWIIPIPARSVDDPAVLTMLKQWLLSFQVYQNDANFCRVTSAIVPSPTIADFSRRLQDELKGTAFEYVDPWKPTIRLPVIVVNESEQQHTVEMDGRLLSFAPPRPKLLEGVPRGGWMVELLGDVREGRAVGELCLPRRLSALAVLNAPGPTSVSKTRFLPLGDGVGGINIRCTDRREFLSIHLPTGDEVLEEVLREVGICPQADDKRACYRPVMRRFGGIGRAAAAFSGQRANVLRSLVRGPLTVDDIRGLAKLGNGRLPELGESQDLGQMLAGLDPASLRIYRRRRQQYRQRELPADTAVGSLLEFWADRGVLSRQWRLGPCHACMRTFWEPRIDIRRPVPCPGCGTRLRLPSQVPTGYSLQRLVGHAIEQGIMPVVLTGRFLKNLSRRGFFWMPGVKYKWDKCEGDIDLFACCDGHIVVGECKTLDGTPADAGVWESILDQFAATLSVGRAVRASFAVLAVMADRIPDGFEAKVAELAGSCLPCLLLTRNDLEQGHRPRERGRLSLADLLVDPMPEAPRDALTPSRQITTALFSMPYETG